MTDAVRALLKVPKGIPTTRYKADPQVEVPEQGEIPLIDKEKPLVERWIAHVRLFDLSKETDLDAYQVVWQKVCDGLAQLCESKTEFIADKGTFIALLRWSESDYKLPGT